MESIKEKKLGNGVVISLSDHSRRIAADRWYIKIVCLCSLKITEDLINSIGHENDEITGCIHSQLGDRAKFELVRERNFVDEGEKDQVVTEIHEKINDLISGYISSAQFPLKMFASSYGDAKMKCLSGWVPKADHHDESDDGPTDFSECFRD